LGNWINWLLLIAGIIFVIVELALGAFTGFDLALVGASLTVGGAIGLLSGSANVGLIAASALALIYFALFRNWLKAKLTVTNHASNADAVVGKTGVVTRRIAPHDPGTVKLGDEVWRAELASGQDSSKDVGATVTVVTVEGVTIKVR
jgi:membrane protein implicated in regulation of membrane protease activity